MIQKIVALVALCLLPALSQADCRRVVVQRQAVVHRNVVEVAAVVAVPVPLFSTGYYAPTVQAIAPPVVPQPAPQTKSEMQQLWEAIQNLSAKVDALTGNKVATTAAVAPADDKLGFLTEKSRCGKCHTGPQSKGKLDLSAGFAKLTDRQLGLLTLLTLDHNVEGAMPPKDSKVEPLKDDEYAALHAATLTELKKR